jgi:hypothetical protein
MVVLLVALAASPVTTDFGVRTVRPIAVEAAPVREAVAPTGVRGFSLTRAASIGARLGRVTSTWRSPERNRRVGGAANSWHLHGRAIDIARRPGVSHAMIEAELRRAGFHLIESLDEGDHSHFAFANGLNMRARPRALGEQVAELRQEASYFRFVSAPPSGGRTKTSSLR